MAILLIFILWPLNFGISWFNAWSVGRSWADSKAIGGMPRFLTWCAVVMSACGFTWCYLVLMGIGAGATGVLEPTYVELFFKLGYVVIILPVLGSGLAIIIDSWTTAYRRRDAVSIGIAGWNTFAQAHNTYEAVRVLPGFLGDIGEAFSGGDGDSAKGAILLLVVALVVLALLGGVFTTVAIVRSTARKYAGRVLPTLEPRMARAR